MSTKATTRLPALPTDIREGFAAYYEHSYRGQRNDPENCHGSFSIYRRETADVAAIRTADITYYRGRARSLGDDSTRVSVVAVYEGKVIAHSDMPVTAVRARKVTSWNTLSEKVDYEDPTQRKRALIAGEHQVAARMKANHIEVVEKAKAKLAKEAHEALASTKLDKVRERIAGHKKALKELRALESGLARQAKKEAAA